MTHPNDGIASLRTETIDQIRNDLELHALVCFAPENVRYLSGAPIFTQRLLPHRRMLLVGKDGEEPTLLVNSIEAGYIRSRCPSIQIREYQAFGGSPIPELVTLLEPLGDGHRIGVEISAVTRDEFREFTSALGPRRRFSLIDSTPALETRRRIKDDVEIDHMKAIARATDAALREALDSSTIGESEHTIARRLVDNLLGVNADFVAWALVGSGRNSSYVHGVPGSVSVVPGSLVRLDCGAHFDDYFSDLGRTALTAPVRGDLASVYQGLVELQHILVDWLEPGMAGAAIFSHAARLLSNSKHPLRLEGPGIGHGIGLSVHEGPNLRPTEEITLAPRMLLCLEVPLFYEEHLFVSEDLIEIHDGGARYLTDARAWESIPVLF